MALYHLEVKKISRGKGRSSIAAGAYQMREKFNEFDAQGNIIKTFNYKKKGGVVAKGVLYNKLFKNPEDFFNKLGLRENRKNSCTAREIVIALPIELNHNQNKSLVQDFCRHLFRTYRCGVAYAIHQPTPAEIKRGASYKNIHAHVIISTRELDPNSNYNLGKKLRIFDDLKTGKETIKNIRTAYEKLQNQYLERAGLDIKVSAKSYKEQGIDKVPTKHIGYKATNLERRINNDRKKKGLEPNFKSRKRRKIEAEIARQEIENLDKKILAEQQIILNNNRQIELLQAEINDYIDRQNKLWHEQEYFNKLNSETALNNKLKHEINIIETNLKNRRTLLAQHRQEINNKKEIENIKNLIIATNSNLKFSTAKIATINNNSFPNIKTNLRDYTGNLREQTANISKIYSKINQIFSFIIDKLTKPIKKLTEKILNSNKNIKKSLEKEYFSTLQSTNRHLYTKFLMKPENQLNSLLIKSQNNNLFLDKLNNKFNTNNDINKPQEQPTPFK